MIAGTFISLLLPSTHLYVMYIHAYIHTYTHTYIHICNLHKILAATVFDRNYGYARLARGLL